MRPDSVEAIILAAGSSSRLQMFKPGALLFGAPLIGHCIAGLRQCCERIIVVGGDRCESLSGLLVDESGVLPAGVELVRNRHWQRGMFSSVRTGALHVRAERFFVLPVDCPLVPPETYRKLLSCAADAVVPTYRGRRGHPVLLHRSLIEVITREPESSTLRATMSRARVQEVAVEAPEILFDVDTPEDLERIARLDGAR